MVYKGDYLSPIGGIEGEYGKVEMRLENMEM